MYNFAMSVELFKKYCSDHGLSFEIIQEGSKTHTAQDSSRNFGIELNRIVKSLVVKIDDDFVIFLVPGDKRLNFNMLKERFGARDVRMANADEVKDVTSYSIGGVPPFGFAHKLKTYIKEGFPKNLPLLAAAGKEDAVFWVSLEELKKVTNKQK